MNASHLRSRSLFLAGAGLVAASVAKAAEPTQRDIEYARAGEHSLKLDLYLPEATPNRHPGKPPLVVWVHGGAWRAGSKENMQVPGLLEHGFAIASVGYRLSPVAPFPAQVHDIKAAIRYLRAHGSDHDYDPSRIVIAGASAGGHLAALVGLTNGHPELEGSVGDHGDQSSDVHAIVDYYGPANFMTILQQSTPHGLGVRIPALQLLLRSQPEGAPELAKLASPVFHVDANDPPLLLIHGDQDPQVPINQSHELQGKYKSLGLADRVQFEVIHGGLHGGKGFYEAETTEIVAGFLKQVFKEK